VTKFLLIPCAALIVVTACNSGGERAASETNPAVFEKIRNDYIAAWKSGSADRVAGMYTSDGVVMYPNHPVITGTTAIRDYYQKLFDQVTPVAFEILSDEVIVSGDWAIDRGRYKLTITPKAGGAAINDEGKFLVVLQKQADGSYKVARDIDNTSAPLPPAAAEPAKKQ
jgi:uncharacterized protein (TIGR02246 family)